MLEFMSQNAVKKIPCIRVKLSLYSSSALPSDDDQILTLLNEKKQSKKKKQGRELHDFSSCDKI